MNPSERRSTGWTLFDAQPDEKLYSDDWVTDVQYILQTLTGIEDRLVKVEDSISRQGKDISIQRYIWGSSDRKNSYGLPIGPGILETLSKYIPSKDEALNQLMEHDESSTDTKTDNFQLNMILGSPSFAD